MHIAYHLGAHCTDDDKLVKSLLRNNGILSKNGVIVPGPGRYRKVISDVVGKLKGGKASPETQDVLLETILDVDHAERLVLSHANFLGIHSRALEHGQLYHLAPDKVTRLRNLFPDNPVSFHIAMRDPATLVPALFALSEETDFLKFLGNVDPLELSWATVIASIREAAPDCPVVCWCNEDTPMIWPEVMAEVAGINRGEVKLKGGLDILSEIMAKEGVQRLRAYMASHPPQSEMQRRRILAAFLDKYALEEEVVEELDLPGWTAELVEDLSANYDDDMLEIARMPGVTLLAM